MAGRVVKDRRVDGMGGKVAVNAFFPSYFHKHGNVMMDGLALGGKGIVHF